MSPYAKTKLYLPHAGEQFPLTLPQRESPPLSPPRPGPSLSEDEAEATAARPRTSAFQMLTIVLRGLGKAGKSARWRVGFSAGSRRVVGKPEGAGQRWARLGYVRRTKYSREGERAIGREARQPFLDFPSRSLGMKRACVEMKRKGG